MTIDVYFWAKWWWVSWHVAVEFLIHGACVLIGQDTGL